jgi:hypothetical protein
MTRTKVEEGSRADGILSRLRNGGRFLFSQAFASGQVRLSSNLKREAESLTWLLSCVYTVQAAEDDSTAGRRGPVYVCNSADLWRLVGPRCVAMAK